MIGEKIRDYEIQSELGSGGYGVVYRAHDASVDRDVAIKVILPQYVNQPEFVESFLGILNGTPGEMNIGALPAIYNVLGLLYMLGGFLFGIVTFRAHVLPRRVGALLAIASILTPLAAILPHELQRLAGMPVGIAIALLGFALWNERRTETSATVQTIDNLQLRQTGAD